MLSFIGLAIITLLFATDVSAFAKKTPAAPETAYASRQMTRSKLVRKAEREKYRKTHPRALSPRQSPGLIERCQEIQVSSGWATYEGQSNGYGNNRLGTVKVNGGPEECEQYCLSFGEECIAFTWSGSPSGYPVCEAKSNADDVARNMKEDNTRYRGTTWLRGTCSEYASEISGTCCNSNPGDTCSADRKTGAAYAAYTGKDGQPGADLGPLNRSALTPESCRAHCESYGDQCVGFTLNLANSRPYCVAKQDARKVFEEMLDIEGDVTTYVKGTCVQWADRMQEFHGYGDPCCNTP